MAGSEAPDQRVAGILQHSRGPPPASLNRGCRNATMSDGNGNGPESTTEALKQWLDENEKHAAVVDRALEKNAARNAAVERMRASHTMQAVVRERAAEEFRSSALVAGDVVDTLSRLLAIRDAKLTELVHLVKQSENANSFLNDRPDSAGTEEASTLRTRADKALWGARRRIIQLVGDLTSFDSDLASTFAKSKTLDRARGLIQEYEDDGMVTDPPPQLRGNPLRRLQQCVYEAFDWTILVVEKVYNNTPLLDLNHTDLVSKLRQQLGESHAGVLCASALTIDLVRLRRDPGTPPYDQAESEERLLRHLCDKEFVRRLRPYKRNGSEGRGPKEACFALIADMTGLSQSTVRDYVTHCERERDKMFAYQNSDDIELPSRADGLSTYNWDRMPHRVLMKTLASVNAELDRRRQEDPGGVADAERRVASRKRITRSSR